MEVPKSVRFMTTDLDRSLLDKITKQDGDSSMSATIRRLIRDEAKRRGIEAVSQEPHNSPVK